MRVVPLRSAQCSFQIVPRPERKYDQSALHIFRLCMSDGVAASAMDLIKTQLSESVFAGGGEMGARTRHLRLVSTSDVFTPRGRTKNGVIWELADRKIDDKTCEFTNTVQSCATPGLLDFLGKQRIPLDVFRSARKPISEAHNRQET